MRFALLGLCLIGCPSGPSPGVYAAASASSPSSSVATIESSTSPRDAAVEAAAPTLARCFEPSSVTQLGTIKNQLVSWDEDLVSDGSKRFDPETLDVVPTPVRSARAPTDLLATGERVEQGKTMLVAGARTLAKLDEGLVFDHVENGRWVILAAGDAASSFEVVDGLARKKDPRRYVAVHGDLGAFMDDSTASMTVKNLLTHAIVVKDVANCAAGGMINWSLSSRFLWCESNRSGSTGYDLRNGKDLYLGQSVALSPDESYVVRVPGKGWGENVISEDAAEWMSTGTRRSVTLSKNVPRATDQTPAMTSTVPVAFCGDGKLFAIVTKKDLVVYRGSDAHELASAASKPGGEIAFSRSGRYVLDKRAGAATVYRLDVTPSSPRVP